MRLIEQTEKYVVDSEEDAIKIIQNFKTDAESKGYILSKSGYTYKVKKSIDGQVWVVTITKILGGVWDDYE